MNIPHEVFNMFERFAIEIRDQGFARYSADAILHRIRWHYNIEIGNRSFKANNNWTPVLARWLITKRPDFATFFQLRYSQAAADVVTPPIGMSVYLHKEDRTAA